MIFEVSEKQVRQAQFPHNLFVTGIFFFDLLLTPAAIVMNIGLYALLLPLACSLLVIAVIYVRSRKATVWFVDAHWRLAWRHGQWLMLGYAVTAGFMLLAWLLSLSADAHMKHIMLTALTRIAVLPTLVAVMVTVVMEASALALAGKGEVPDRIVQKYPPPS
jgi:hypothetical protein